MIYKFFELLENVLKKLCKVVKNILQKLSIDGARSVKIEDEVKKNNAVSFYIFLSNALAIILNCTSLNAKAGTTVVLHIRFDLEAVTAIFFMVILILILYTSNLWNFFCCPEKKIIKKYVTAQLIVRFFMVADYCVNITLKKYFWFGVILCLLSILDIALCFIIKQKSKKVVMHKTPEFDFEPITEWEKNNIKDMINSKSDLGIVLYIMSLYFFSEQITLVRFCIKACVLALAIYRINTKLLYFYEDKGKGRKKNIFINVFLIAGFLVQVAGNCICFYYFQLANETLRTVNDVFILIGILFGLPLYNEYVKISRRIRIIMI